MRKFAVALAVLASLTSSAVAQEIPLMVRLRAVGVVPADKSSAGALPADAVHVSNKLIPEVDFTYFFLLPNLSAELILTYPQKHDVTLKDGGNIGTVTHLPPCLTAQWHFLPGAVANPYLGAGVNLTLITDQDLGKGTLKLDPKTSVGFAAQAGIDVKVAPQVFLNFDVKYVTPLAFDVKAKADNSKVTTVNLDPWLFGAGVGYRF
jgi:outer membrane protein